MTNYAYGFDTCKSEEEVKNRLRSLSKILHPDHEGDALLFGNCKQEAERRIRELRGEETATPPPPKRPRTRPQTDSVTAFVGALLGRPEVQKAVVDACLDGAPESVRKIAMEIAQRITERR